MAATPPAAREAAPSPSALSPAPHAQDRRLRLEDILKLMVVDGLVSAADADALARSRGSRGNHPLEFIANQRWKAAAHPHAHPVTTTVFSGISPCFAMHCCTP